MLDPWSLSRESLRQAREAPLDWYAKQGLKDAALTERVNRAMVCQFGDSCESLEEGKGPSD